MRWYASRRAGRFGTGRCRLNEHRLPLRSLALPSPSPEERGAFPWSIPALHDLGTLSFERPVTLLVGENGSGKSTLLEALAYAAGMVTAGSQPVRRDPSLAHIAPVGGRMRLVWNRRTKRGFFLRAEDYFGYVKEMARSRAEMQQEMEDVERRYADRSEQARGLARMPFARELHDMKRRYGDGLDSVSHGESFLKFFQARFAPGGLYLLDEPEAPLSPHRQLAFLAMIKQMAAEGAQFVIATHAPILMAYPDATLLSLDEGTLHEAEFGTLPHVMLLRDFLAAPDRYLRHL